MLCLEIAGWVANSVDPDEMPHSAAFIWVFVCLCCDFMAQSTQWGHVERGQFT